MERLTPLHVLLYAREGYRLTDDERCALEERGWARSMRRDLVPLLRRARVLAWEIMRLEERRRDRMPSSHPFVRLAEAAPPFRRRREREIQALAREIEKREAERAVLAAQLTPLLHDERDRLAAYRPVSDTHCLRLTDEGRKELANIWFPSPDRTLDAAPGTLEERIRRMEAMYRALVGAGWWQDRLRQTPALKARATADALWMAAILSRHGRDPRDAEEDVGATLAAFRRWHLWRQDPWPLCLVLHSAGARPTMEVVRETNDALVAAGFGVGIPVTAAAAVLAAGTPPSELSYRVTEVHRFWKSWCGYGLAFSDGLLPAAARLAGVRRPIERTALLLREFDNRTAYHDRMSDLATRVAATFLAQLTLDYRERGEGLDLFSREEPYVQRMMRRYRTLRAALVPRCRSERPGDSGATVLAGLLALCPGGPDEIVDRFDGTRRLLAGADLPPERDTAGVVALVMDSSYREECGIEHSRAVWDLYFSLVP